jgi:hypothetical protein
VRAGFHVVAVVGYTTQSLVLYPFPTRFAIASVSMCHVPQFDTRKIETNKRNKRNSDSGAANGFNGCGVLRVAKRGFGDLVVS